MFRRFASGMLACLLLGLAFVASADAQSLWANTQSDDDLVVSLVTFGRGPAIHQYFGHNALLVQDRKRDVGVLYNFGMFSFGPDMLPKYLQGKLEFWSAATPVHATYRSYVQANRSIRVKELNLLPARRRALAERLDFYVQPENSSYLYDHYLNNCSTKVRDLIDGALGGQFKKAHSKRGRFTYRGHTRRYSQQDPIVHMLLLFWMNDSMERPIREWDEAFLPDELERIVAATTYVDDNGHKQPLVRLAYTVFEASGPPVPETPSRAWPGLLAVGSAFGLLAILLAAWMRRGSRVARVLLGLHHVVLGVAVGVPGLVAGLFLFTQWEVTHYNENLLLANPLSFLLFPLGFWSAIGSPKALRGVCTICLTLGATTLLLILLKTLPAFDQDIHLPLALLGPVNVGCAIAHLGLRRSVSPRTATHPGTPSSTPQVS